LVNGVSKLATAWFGDGERGLATALGSLTTPIGCIVGLVMGPIFVAEYKDGGDVSRAQQEIGHYMMISGGITTCMCLPLLIFFEERPEKFPSKSAKFSSSQKFNFMSDLKLLATNRNYILICLNFAMLYGVYTCLGAIINNVTSPFGYTSTDSSIFGGIFIFCGLSGSFTVSSYLDKSPKYLRTLRMICFGTLIASTIFLFVLPKANLLLTVLNIAILGIILLPIIPLCYSFSIELTFPVSEAMSNGVMMMFSQIVGSITTVLGTKLASYHPESEYTIIMFLGMMSVSCFTSLFIKEDLRRINMSRNTISEKVGAQAT
jgi:sugar phosphate permease